MTTPSELLPLFTSVAGIRYYIRDDGETCEVHAFGDTDDIIERNKAMATHNDGYNSDRTLRRAASIPLILVYKWLVEEGWNALDPEHGDRLKRKLNDPEYAFLRTAPGRL